MPRGRSQEDQAMLEMALIGYQHEREKITARIQELHAMLKGNSAAAPAKAAAAPKSATRRRAMSPAARKRIAAAQKKRWAEHRKRQAAGKA
jgi:hypothetical protein